MDKKQQAKELLIGFMERMFKKARVGLNMHDKEELSTFIDLLFDSDNTPSNNRMEILKVKNYTKKRVGQYLQHEATVIVSGYDNNPKELVWAVSTACKYNPAGYGLWDHTVLREKEDREYYVKWKTGTSCD